MPRRRSKPTAARLGKAAVLSPELWQLWVQHVLAFSPWLAACLILTHCLALRITEALSLRARDFDWRSLTVRVAALKWGKTMRKPILKAVRPTIQALRKSGLQSTRVRSCGARGRKRRAEVWRWPEADQCFLFSSSRSDSQQARRFKDSVCKSLSRLRRTFQPPKTKLGSVDLECIRSHSGRQSWINLCKLSAVPDSIGMEFARIQDLRTSVRASIVKGPVGVADTTACKHPVDFLKVLTSVSLCAGTTKVTAP